MSRRSGWILGLLVLAVAGGAHVFYWYAPRERPGTPDPADPAAALLADDRFSSVLWIPHPHQNLGILERAVGGLDRYLAAAARTAGVSEPILPSFGPFRVPPASALALGVEGDDLLVVAAIHPALSAVSRLAGRLARNPLLAGGRARLGGRDVEARWERGVWWMGSPGLGLPPPSTLPGGSEGVLALARFDRPAAPFPAGFYRLARRQGLLEVEAGEGGLELPDGVALPAAGVLVRGPAGQAGPLRGLAVAPGSGTAGLPRVAVLHRGEGERWRLPGEGLLSLAGRDPERRRAGPWEVTAFDRAGLALGIEVAEGLAPLLAAPSSAGLRLALWIEPGTAHETAEQVAEVLEALPPLSLHARPWRDAASLLAPLPRGRPLVVLATGDPPALRARLGPPV